MDGTALKPATLARSGQSGQPGERPMSEPERRRPFLSATTLPSFVSMRLARMPKHHYQLVDVFTDRQFGGNPLAVFADATQIPEKYFQPKRYFSSIWTPNLLWVQS